VNGHGGNETAIANALHDMQGNIDAKVYSVDWWSLATDKIAEIVTPPVYHACDMETSVAWYLGQRVLEDKRVDEQGKAPVPGFVVPDMLAPPPHVSTSYSMKEITNSGVVGYSTKATKEKGKLIVDIVLDRLTAFIEEIAKM
jgi:creatinine amidohydrolase